MRGWKVICPKRAECERADCEHRVIHDCRKYDCNENTCFWKMEFVYCVGIVDDISRNIKSEIERILEI